MPPDELDDDELEDPDELEDVDATAAGSGPLPKSGEPLAYAPATTMLPASSTNIEVGLAVLASPPTCQGDAHTPAGLQCPVLLQFVPIGHDALPLLVDEVDELDEVDEVDELLDDDALAEVLDDELPPVPLPDDDELAELLDDALDAELLDATPPLDEALLLEDPAPIAPLLALVALLELLELLDPPVQD